MVEVIKYQFKCIDTKSDCSYAEKEAAIMDFVNAAFVENDGSKYDGQLTPEERAVVEKEFGKLSYPAEYLSRANNSFFSKFGKIPYCSYRFPKYESVVNSKFGVGEFIGGYHGCGETTVDKMFNEGLFFDIIANPNEWVLFVEGYNINYLNSQELIPELPYFNLLARILNIPIHDPIVALWNERVVNSLPENYGKINFMIDECVSHVVLIAREMMNNETFESLEYPIEKSIDVTIEVFKFYNVSVDRELLRKKLTDHLALKDEEDINAMLDRVSRQFADNYMNVVAPISNRLSSEQVKNILQTEGRKKALFIIGEGHMSIMKVYQE